ncbi:MAG TPA: hypothetical protein DCS93_20345 [Microscillaceae bacterium]|nr:hypothetical protein [Microscillaceae bacterium]
MQRERYNQYQDLLPGLSQKLKFLSFLCFFLWAIPGQSQKPNSTFQFKQEGLLKVTNFLPNEYKGHAQNWSISQDKRGVMYIANINGVLQYDGHEWRSFPIKDFQVARDKNGRIYTHLGYLEVDSLNQIQYHSFKPLLATKDYSLTNFATREIVITDKFVAFHKVGSLILYQNNQLEVIPLSNDFIRPMFSINQEIYMAKKGTGLMKLTAQKQWKLVFGGEIFADKNITSAVPFGQDQWLLSTFQNGLYLMDSTGFRAWDVPSNNFLKSNQINCSLVLSDRLIALGTLRNGVMIIDHQGNLVQHINQSNGLKSNYVRALFLDKDKALWLALNNGIARVETDSPFSLWNQEVGLKGSVNYIAALHRNRFYVGTSQGVFYRNYQTPSIPNSSRGQFKLIANTSGSIYHLLTTSKGILCAHRKGVFLVQDTTAQKLVTTPSIVFTMIPASFAGKKYAVAGTTKGMLLLEETASGWRYKFPIQGHQVYTRHLYQDAQGYLWITAEEGIYRMKLSPTLDRIVEKKLYAIREGLPTEKENRVFGLFNQQLLVGTTQGVYIYEAAKDRFTPHPIFTTQLKIKDVVQWIKADKQGGIWLWTKSGVIYAKQEENNNFTLERNLFKPYRELFSNYIAPQVIPINKQNILFATRDGVVHYNSLLKTDYQKPFEVLIRKVSIVKGKDSLFFGGNFTQARPDVFISDQPNTKIPTFPYKFNHLRFTCSAVYYANAPQTQYQYLLDGFEKKWSDWTTTTSKEFTNLPAGSYTFKVRARNVYGTLGKIAIYRFTINPPWYQTNWAYGAFGLLICLLLWGIIYLNTYRLKQHKNHLETVVNERTQEIRQQNHTLETQKEEILTQAQKLEEQTNYLKSANDEIAHQNIELEKQKEEILTQAQNLSKQAEYLRFANQEIAQKNSVLEKQKEEINQAYQNIQLLSEIGKKITSTFSSRDINQIVYESIQDLMDVAAFGIGYYKSKDNIIDYGGYFYQGQAPIPPTVSMESKNHLAVYCIEHQKEVVVGDIATEYTNYVPTLADYKKEDLYNSMIYLPLIVRDEIIGVLSIKSHKKHAYNQNQLNILRNLSIYIAIATKNATSFAILDLQNHLITDSIVYAQNIQQAILPTPTTLKECLNEYFLIYWPKDIVSGDFYWLFEHTIPQTQETFTFIAVIDCTGHGVPGAFMSLIGYQMLDEIVKEKQVLEPHLILECLDKLIIDSLKQKESDNTEGMDVCMCRLKKRSDGQTEVHFSGARRDLVYVEHNILSKIKGDRTSIGGYFEGNHKRFKNHVITLAPGTLLYLSSDGMADMPNAKRRSFSSRRLEELLKTNAPLPLVKQKQAVIKAINTHRGKQEQRDDVTLLAVKL